MKLHNEIDKFFKNYALEQFGTSILQEKSREEVGLKLLFEHIIENQLKKHKMDPKF
jgi:hypothetical protein